MFKNLVLISIISLPLASENLLDIYNEALDNDPQYKSSEYSLLAGKEFVVQGRAGLFPNVTLNASTNWNEYYQFDELQSAYNNNSVSARLTQPLFRLDSWFNFRRSKKLTDASEADFAYAQQNLIIRTVEKYFGVLRAIDNLNAAVSEEKAIKKQLDQIQQRFEVGLSAITEVQEAQLAYDLSVASKIRSEGALFNSREELNSLIGREIFTLDTLKADIIPENPNPTTKQEWVDIALKNNFRLKASVLRRDASKDSARSSPSEHIPKINIVGSESESNTNQYSYEGFEEYNCSFFSTPNYDALKYTFAKSKGAINSYSFADILDNSKNPYFNNVIEIIDELFSQQIFALWGKESIEKYNIKIQDLYKNYINLEKIKEQI